MESISYGERDVLKIVFDILKSILERSVLA